MPRTRPIAPDHRFRGCLLGLACGDAVGTTVEFQPRGRFTPVTDMVGGGVFRLPLGAWTDDTSMALCLAASLVELGRFDATDQMTRYRRWAEEGYLSSTGRCFDIGGTVSSALDRFERTGEPFSGSTDPHSAGNGCIMRLAPVPMFYHADRAAALEYSALSARTTHGAVECLEASRLLGGILHQALSGADKEAVVLDHGVDDLTSPRIQAIARGAYRTKVETDIRGSGYVVHCLEAALWCFWRTADFEAAILQAANLGDDADTTAAVCGQIAGAFHGADGIPPRWLDRLVQRDLITELADRLHRGPAPAPAQ